jgi:HD-like signal output (HDOD) protein
MNTNNTGSAKELVAGVQDVFTLPDMYLKIKEVVEDEDSSIADVAEIVSGDPAVTARLLRFANSAFFGMPSKVDTISRAVNILGTQLVHDVVLATSVSESCGADTDAFDQRAFWSDSAYCAVLSRLLAQHCNVLDSERVFLEGLLRDIGHLVIYQQIPERAAEAKRRSLSTDVELYQAERELIGYDYGQVGQELMALWGLPPSLGEVARYHVEPAGSNSCPLETAIVHIAHHMMLQSGVDGDSVDGNLLVSEDAWKITGLSEAVLVPVKAAADACVAEARQIFLDAA